VLCATGAVLLALYTKKKKKHALALMPAANGLMLTF
jgi:hypothetical protein